MCVVFIGMYYVYGLFVVLVGGFGGEWQVGLFGYW